MALITLGSFFIGWNESICQTNSTILIRDQRDIGVAGGAAGSVRAAISAVLTAIYTSILSNRLAKTIPNQVPPAIVDAGLPSSSVTAFLTALSVGTADALQSVPGVTQHIIDVGTRAYKVANSDAYRTVYLSTIAFSSVAVILTFFAPNTEDLLNNKVAATLHRQDTKIVVEDVEQAHNEK